MVRGALSSPGIWHLRRRAEAACSPGRASGSTPPYRIPDWELEHPLNTTEAGLR